MYLTAPEMYYEDDSDFGDNDYFEGGDPSSLEFQMHGYGGFGYDTSHVPTDPLPEIVQAAARGDRAGA